MCGYSAQNLTFNLMIPLENLIHFVRVQFIIVHSGLSSLFIFQFPLPVVSAVVAVVLSIQNKQIHPVLTLNRFFIYSRNQSNDIGKLFFSWTRLNKTNINVKDEWRNELLFFVNSLTDDIFFLVKNARKKWRFL